MSLTSLIIKFAAPLPDIESFESFLFVGPHPDDIEIGAGATAAKLAAAGKKVRFLICIDGRFGDGNAPDDMDADGLVALRKSEAIASAKRLGVTDVRFLDFCDGGFYDTNELQTSIARQIGDFKPDVIFAPDPTVSSECHADHLNVGSAVSRLACFAPYPGIMARYGAKSADVKALAYYFTAKPTRFVRTRGYLKAQLEAIFDCHLSQFPKGSDEAKTVALYLKLRSADMGLRCLCTAAEGFRILGATHMHCMPEAGK